MPLIRSGPTPPYKLGEAIGTAGSGEAMLALVWGYQFRVSLQFRGQYDKQLVKYGRKQYGRSQYERSQYGCSQYGRSQYGHSQYGRAADTPRRSSISSIHAGDVHVVLDGHFTSKNGFRTKLICDP